VTVVDWMALGLVLLAALGGAVQGLVWSGLSLAGLIAGAFLGGRLAPLVLTHGSSSPYAPVVALGAAVSLAVAFEVLGSTVGSLIRSQQPRRLRLLDSAGGLVAGALIGLGVIEMRPGRGAYVRRLSLNDVVRMVDGAVRLEYGAALQLHEVRAMIEITAARLAAIRRIDADLARMREAILRYKFAGKSSEPDRLIDADLAFHEAIVVATHNDVLVTVQQSIRGLLREHRRQYGVAGDVDARPLVIAEHEKICAAIAAGDPIRAAKRMQEHMRIIWRQIEELAIHDGDSTLASQAYLPMYDEDEEPPG